MEALTAAVTVLTAMITPAVLISACAALILSTSRRLSRVVDNVRVLSDKLEEISHGETKIEHFKERCAVIFSQLDKLTIRAKILQRTIMVLNATLAAFVVTSIAIAVVAVSGSQYGWVPVGTGIGGACLLFSASLMMIYETRLSLSTTNAEMNFIWHLAKHHAPEEYAEFFQPPPANLFNFFS